MSKALSEGTQLAYKRAYKNFKAFAVEHDLPYVLPLHTEHVLCFISYLYDKGFPSSSIASILSGIGYMHKQGNLHDPTHDFSVMQLMTSIRKQRPSVDSRKPISENILFSIFDVLISFNLAYYDRLLLQSLYLFVFYFALRIGEVTKSEHNIQVNQVEIIEDKMSLAFVSYKHSPLQPFVHTIKATKTQYCPVNAMRKYMSVRGLEQGPLFVRMGKPLSQSYFSNYLKEALNMAGIDNENISAHSFRIGAASFWASKGMSELEIKRLGRWKSDAWKKYMRHDVNHIT